MTSRDPQKVTRITLDCNQSNVYFMHTKRWYYYERTTTTTTTTTVLLLLQLQ